MTTPLRAGSIAVLALAAASWLGSQERRFALTAPTWTLAEPLSRIAGLGTLADGRLLLSDSKERQLSIAARDGKSLAPFGSQGEGPGEYRLPFTVHRGRGDTLFAYDAGNRRYLRVTSDGRLATDLVVPQAFLMGGGLAPPRGIDAQGAIYWQADVIGDENGVPRRRETQNVRRWLPGAARLDTVAVVRDHHAAMRVHRFFPFAERDVFVVARDGRVGVLSAADYRLTWVRDGRAAGTGPALAHESAPVTAADRNAYRRERAQSPAGMARAGPAAGDAEPTPQMMQRMAEYYPDESFPVRKPPFVEDGALISPGQDVWVTRSGPLAERETRIDVIANDGSRRGFLRLPAGRRLVALEADGVYLARVDDEGLEWLERYAWPAGLR